MNIATLSFVLGLAVVIGGIPFFMTLLLESKEERDKDKVAERLRNEIDFDERSRAEWDYENRGKDVNTVIKGLIVRRIFKEIKGQDENLELIIEDNCSFYTHFH